MKKRNIGGFNPRHDLCTDVACLRNGHIVPFGAYHVGPQDDGVDLAEQGDWNEDPHDRSFIHQGGDKDEECFAGQPNEEELALLVESGFISADDPDFILMQEQVQQYFMGLYERSATHPFFLHQKHCGAPRGSKDLRSEALSVSCGRGIARPEALHRDKHRQFYRGIPVT